MRRLKPGKGGARVGAGRPTLDPSGQKRRSRTIVVTDAEYVLVREWIQAQREAVTKEDDW
jgi:hypothetical protein